jgi:hypothetical protein
MEYRKALEYLKQKDRRQASAQEGHDHWTALYLDWDEGDDNGGYYACFSLPEYRKAALSCAGWDISIGDGQPAFSVSYEDGEKVVRYERYPRDGLIQPILICQQMNGTADDQLLLSEEFRLLMNLWEDKETGDYYSINDDGTKALAVEVKARQVRVRTSLLRRYQAARQLDVLLFCDSVRSVRGDFSSIDFEELIEKDHLVNADTVVHLGIGEYEKSHVFSRFLSTRVLTPPRQQESGIWPWEPPEEYPEFIIGEKDNGSPLLYTCNPDLLSNYFGKNPDAPHYMTPVFFKKDVLQKYYDNSELYSVKDGKIVCGSLWQIQIDNHNTDAVAAFLGDLGRDLPDSDRPYWKSFNISPPHRISDTTWQRAFGGYPAVSSNPEHLFRAAYERAVEEWSKTWGWSLFRKPVSSDANLVKEVRVPLNETPGEFEGQILRLCKLLVDLLNEKGLAQYLDKAHDEKGISKLERFLQAQGYECTQQDIGFLRRLQKLRTKLVAHSKGSEYESLLASELDGRSRTDYVIALLSDATAMLERFAGFTPCAIVEQGGHCNHNPVQVVDAFGERMGQHT